MRREDQRKEGNYDYFDYSQKPYSPRPSDFDSVSSYDTAKDTDQYSDDSYVPPVDAPVEDQWTWRRASNSVENSTRSGEHKEVIASMQNSTSEKDKKLLHVLAMITEEDYDHATDTPTDPYEADGDDLSETHSYGDGDEDVIRSECEKVDVMHKSDEKGVTDAVQKKGDVKCDVTNESDGKGESHELVTDAEQKQGDVKDRSDENNVKEKNTEAGEDNKGTGSDKEAAEKDMLEGHVNKVLCDETVSHDKTSYIEIKPVQSVQLTGVVNLSGQYVQDASTGALYNINDLDISQLTQIYLIDVPQQETEIQTTEMNYTISAIVEDVEVKTEKENDEQGTTSKESKQKVGNKEHEDKESQKETREKEKDAVKLQKKELQIISEEKGDAESGKEDSV